MGRRINPDHIASWYNPYELKALFYHAGYDDYGEVAKDMLGVSSAVVARRKINHSSLTHEDTIALAKGLHMTQRDYIRVFLRDTFDE